MKGHRKSYQEKFFTNLKESIVMNGNEISSCYSGRSGAIKLANQLGDFVGLMGSHDGDRIIDKSYALIFEKIYTDQAVLLSEKEWRKQIQLGRHKWKRTKNNDQER